MASCNSNKKTDCKCKWFGKNTNNFNRKNMPKAGAVPIMLEIGKEPVYGAATDELLAEAAADLVAEAMGPAPKASARS